MHIFFNVKLDDQTPCLYSVQTKNGEQTIWDKFEIATFSQTKLQFQNFPHVYLFMF